MADALHSRLARRQMFMERLFIALAPVIGPRVSLEAHGGKGVSVLVDGGRSGTMFTRAAPWLPRLTAATDLTETARGVADAVMWVATTDFPPDTTHVGPQWPTVTRANKRVRVQFFGVTGEPLPVVEVPLHQDDE